MKNKMTSMAAFAFLVLAFLSMACGCTRTIYEQVETTSRDSISSEWSFTEQQYQMLLSSIKRTANTRDSVFIRDSTIIVVNQQGDVVSRERFRDSDRNHIQTEVVEKLQQKYDSIFNAQRSEFNALLEKMEQIPVPVERKLSKWEKLKQDVGGIAIGVLAAVIAYLIVWLVRRFRLKA